MSTGSILLILGLLGVVHMLNAFHPVKTPRVLFAFGFFGAWLTLELLYHHIVYGAIFIAVGIARGGLDSTAGICGLLLIAIADIGFVVLAVRQRHTKVIVQDALGDLDPQGAPRYPRSHLVFPMLLGFLVRRGVRRQRNITFAEHGQKPLKLDVYSPEAPPASGELRPAIIQIHGGGWVIGDKREQGLPLLNHLAANGWVCFNVNYRLSPKATFPDHLVDCKLAVAWVREHAAEYGVDPTFIAVTGGSAGGHLAAMVALTADDKSFQPGFEAADTSVQAGVPFYGVYDLTDREGVWTKDAVERFVEKWVMKKRLADDPEAFAAASPVDRAVASAPPMFIIHGDKDTLAPVEYARMLVERLREVSHQPVLYAEMQGAQHAFEVFPSPRTAEVIEAVERFLHHVWVDHQQGDEPSTAALASDLVDSPN